MHKLHTTQGGFTLIELLVVVVIMMMVMGSGIAAYVNLNDRQNVFNAAKELQGLMRTAQEKSRAEDKPTGCGHLLGYSVVVTNVNLGYAELHAVCDNQTYVQSSYTLPNGVTVQAPINMVFQVLVGGVTNSGTVSVGATHWLYTFSVNSGGSITDGSIAAR